LDNLTERSHTPLNSDRAKGADDNKVNFTQISDEILFEEQNNSTQLLSTDGETVTLILEQKSDLNDEEHNFILTDLLALDQISIGKQHDVISKRKDQQVTDRRPVKIKDMLLLLQQH
jgi:hypothetical protein